MIPSNNSGIMFRLCFISLVALVSLWANHEASKGFSVTVVNEAGDTISGRRFNLFYTSNDEATRTILKASKAVEDFLYPGGGGGDGTAISKKQVNRVICKLSSRNLTDEVVVDPDGPDGFVLKLSPSIMEGRNFRRDVFLAVQRGLARVWLWNGRGKCPKVLINGIVDCMMINFQEHGRLSSNWQEVPLPETSAPASASGCLSNESPKSVAGFLNYMEHRRPGFIRKLNQDMKDEWRDGMLAAAFGQPISMYNSSST